MTARERRVLLVMPIGREKALRRKVLAAALGIPDRELRQIISSLQDKGYQIVNFQNGDGYYLADNVEEVLHYRAQERKRGRSLIDKARRIKFFPDIEERIAALREEI